jgi:uncharacterized membrane protein YvbJ
MVFCTKCGFEITKESDKFCVKCGHPLKLPEENLNKNISQKKSGKKTNVWTVLAIGAIVVIGVIMLPSIIGFDEAQNAHNFQKKKAECDANADWIYVDGDGRFCCTSEKHVVFVDYGEVCPKLKFIYP